MKKEDVIEEKEENEEIKEQKTKKTKKKYIKSKKPLQRIRLEIHNDTSSSEDDENEEEEIKTPKKLKSKKMVEEKEELETIKETPIDYYSDSATVYRQKHDVFGRPIKRF